MAFTSWHTLVYDLDIGNTVGLVALVNINKQVHNVVP